MLTLMKKPDLVWKNLADQCAISVCLSLSAHTVFSVSLLDLYSYQTTPEYTRIH